MNSLGDHNTQFDSCVCPTALAFKAPFLSGHFLHWHIKASATSISEQKISWLSNSLTGFAMGTFGFTSVLLASLRATEANSGNQFTSTLKLKRKSVSVAEESNFCVYFSNSSVHENDLLHEPLPVSPYLYKS